MELSFSRLRNLTLAKLIPSAINPPATIMTERLINIFLIAFISSVVLADAAQAFAPLTPVSLSLDRIETNPRFAAIARPPNAAIVVKLRIDMEDRGGRLELLLPYATLEPIRKMLLQQFMGEKFGRDNIWEGHLASELWATRLELRAVLDEVSRPLRDVLNLKVGDTMLLDALPDAPVKLKCGQVDLTDGSVGRMGHSLAVRVDKTITSGAKQALIGGKK